MLAWLPGMDADELQTTGISRGDPQATSATAWPVRPWVIGTPWRRILVHLDADGRAEARLQAAAMAGAVLESPVLVLYASRPAMLHVLVPGGPVLSRPMPVLDLARRNAVRAVFDAWVAGGRRLARWQEALIQDVGGCITAHARVADLLILGQSVLDGLPNASVPRHVAEDVLLSCGRPSVVVPAVGDIPRPDDIVLAWKATPECARATAAALPFMRKARRTVVVDFGGDRADARALLDWLQLFGVQAQLQHEATEPEHLPEKLLSLLSDLGAGLLVMGCYGHGRVTERLFGGVTRVVLRSMTIPVLMSH